MPYESLRDHLSRGLEQTGVGLSPKEKLFVEALHQLTVVLESDLTQIKVALAHVAHLLEERED